MKLKQLFCKHSYANIYMKNHIGVKYMFVLNIDVCKKCLKVKISAHRKDKYVRSNH
jgi:hypothetical protein